MLTLCASISAFAQVSYTVGTTGANYPTLEAAITAVNTNGDAVATNTITLITDITVSADITMPDKPTLITSSGNRTLTFSGGTDYLALRAVNAAAPLSFDNLVIAGYYAVLYGNGFPIKLLSGVTDNGTDNCFYSVYGGGTGTVIGDADIVINGGKYHTVYGGGRGTYSGGYYSGGGLTGEAKIVISGSGANITDYVHAGSYRGGYTGSADITVSNGAFVDFIYGSGQAMAVGQGNVGSTVINLLSGATTRKIIGGWSDTTVDDVTVVVHGGTVGSGETVIGAATKITGYYTTLAEGNWNTADFISGTNLFPLITTIFTSGGNAYVSGETAYEDVVVSFLGVIDMSCATVNVSSNADGKYTINGDNTVTFNQNMDVSGITITVAATIGGDDYAFTSTAFHIKINKGAAPANYSVSGLPGTFPSLLAAVNAIDAASAGSYTITLLQDATAGSNITFPANKPISIVSDGGNKKLTIINSARFTANAALTFDNLVLSGVDATLVANGNPVTFGSGIVKDGTNNSFYHVYGGSYSTMSIIRAPSAANTNLTISGGKYGFVFGGGYNGDVTGEASIVVSGSGTEVRSLFGGGRSPAYLNIVTAKTSVVIQNNAEVNLLYAGGRGETNTVAVSLQILSGATVKFSYCFGQLFSSSTGSVSVLLNGGAFTNPIANSNTDNYPPATSANGYYLGDVAGSFKTTDFTANINLFKLDAAPALTTTEGVYTGAATALDVVATLTDKLDLTAATVTASAGSPVVDKTAGTATFNTSETTARLRSASRARKSPERASSSRTSPRQVSAYLSFPLRTNRRPRPRTT
jgi:hypothetical protein